MFLLIIFFTSSFFVSITTSKTFTDGDSFKIISSSNTECLWDKIQFSVEFEIQNLIESYLDFKLNLQLGNSLDTFFSNCIFEVQENSEVVSDHEFWNK